MIAIRFFLVFVFLIFPELSSGKPIRALWVVRNYITAPQSVDEVFAAAVQGRFTDLFVQVRGRGDAYYQSDFVPPSQELQHNFDPLDRCLKLGRQYGIRVHAWINVYLVWSSESPPVSAKHPVRAHPEWLAQNPYVAANSSQSTSNYQILPGTEGLYLSPGNPEARAYLVRVVTELAEKYPLDGIHFDYIRYPNRDFDYSYTMRQQFYAYSGVDPYVLFTRPQEVSRYYGNQGFRQVEQVWGQFRQEQVTAFLRDVRKSLPRRMPPFLLSAAVKPQPELSRQNFYQNWAAWLNERLIDLAVPMNYSPSLEDFAENVSASLKEIPADRLCVGIAIYNQSKYRVLSKIYKLRSLGVYNFSLFSYEGLRNNPDLLMFLANLP